MHEHQYGLITNGLGWGTTIVATSHHNQRPGQQHRFLTTTTSSSTPRGSSPENSTHETIQRDERGGGGERTSNGSSNGSDTKDGRHQRFSMSRTQMRDLAMQRYAEQQQQQQVEAQQEPQEQEQQTQEQQAEFWESLWRDGLTAWDLGRPTPALLSELQYLNVVNHDDDDDDDDSVFGVLVPGCGAGYDLHALAQWFQNQPSPAVKRVVIVGLELSPLSLQRAVSYLHTQQQNPDEQKNQTNRSSTIPTRSGDKELHETTQVRVDLVLGDFFDSCSTWNIQQSFHYYPPQEPLQPPDVVAEPEIKQQISQFHFIFDYCFFCALPPELRPNWGQRMAQLLLPSPPSVGVEDQATAHKRVHPSATSGQLLTLMFPLTDATKKDSSGHAKSQSPLCGPPFAVTVADYQRTLEPHGWFMSKDSPRINPDTIAPRQGMELAAWWSHTPSPNSNEKQKMIQHRDGQTSSNNPLSKL